MEKFIEASSVSKYFSSDEALNFINVGYDDFHVVKPYRIFRTQNFYTWHFVISGSGTLDIYGESYKICAGDSFFIPPDVPMRYFPDESDPWEYVWFASSGDEIKKYACDFGFSHSPLTKCRNFERIKSVLKKLVCSIHSGEGGYYGVLSAFYEIMDVSAATLDSSEISRIGRLIDESFASTSFSIERICSDFGISHAHLLRLFKEKYGTTVVKYVTKKRLMLACELLSEGELSVRSVAYSVGFSDEMHFMKTFKKSYGITALQYRQRQKAML